MMAVKCLKMHILFCQSHSLEVLLYMFFIYSIKVINFPDCYFTEYFSNGLIKTSINSSSALQLVLKGDLFFVEGWKVFRKFKKIIYEYMLWLIWFLEYFLASCLALV